MTTPTPEEFGEATGQVFIVTAGRENIKMGLVTVGAIDETTAMEFVRDTQSRNDQLKEEAAKARTRAKVARRDLAAAERKLVEAKEADERDWKAFLRAPNPSSPAHVPYDSVTHNNTLAGAEAEVVARRKVVDGLANPFDNFEAAEFECRNLPVAFAVSKTDADGLFLLRVPRNQRFVLAATASRNVMGRNEFYCWFLTASLDGAPTKRFLLSNDNLTDSGARESLLHTR